MTDWSTAFSLLLPAPTMTAICRLPDVYRGFRFPGEVIAHTVWLYLRFPLSFRDVEELLAERGIRVSYETVRCWVTKFAPQFANELRKREVRPGRVSPGRDGRADRREAALVVACRG